MLDDYGKDMFYEIYVDKNPAQEVLSKIKLFNFYEVSKASFSNRTIVYFDTPDNYLNLANILLSIDLIDGKGELTIERNLDKNKNAKYVRLLETYYKTTPITKGQEIKDFLPFLRRGLYSFFSQPLDFDADALFNKVIPQYAIEIKNESYKIVSFSGFKCWITIENTTYINLSNNRKNYVTYVKISQSEDSVKNDMEDFISKLEKYCKRIYKIDKTKYSECVRLTKDIDTIIAKKKKAQKEHKIFAED